MRQDHRAGPRIFGQNLAAALVLATLMLTGCGLFRQYTPYRGVSVAPPSVPGADNPFAYEVAPLALDNHDLEAESDDDYLVKQLQFPSVGDNGQPGGMVTANYYRSRHPGPKKLLIVLPIWGSYTYPSEEITDGILARANGDTHVLMILGENFLVDWAAMGSAVDEASFMAATGKMAHRIRTSVIDTRRLIDWAENQPDIDGERIGLIGFSLGALVGSLVVLNDDRLAASVLVMGAADFPAIMAACEGRPGAAREAITAAVGWTGTEYEQRMREALGYIDPVRFSGGADPATVLMIDAHYDDCMPKRARDALWRALGQPERYTFRLGHNTAFLFMTPVFANYMRYKIYGFLEQSL